MTEKKLVALFDILGFRDHLNRNPLTQVIEEMARIDKLAAASASAGVILSLRPDGPSPEEVRRHLEQVKFIRFSDTILLYADDESDALVRMLFSTAMLVHHAFQIGVPIRGALTRGDLYVSGDRATYLGEALVRAHDLETAQDWAGVIIDDGPSRIASSSFPPGALHLFRQQGLLFRYCAPMKTGEAKPYDCLGWPLSIPDPPRQLHQRLLAFSGRTDWPARRKIDRTIDFLRAHRAAFPKTRRKSTRKG